MESIQDKIMAKLDDLTLDFSTRCDIAHGIFISSSSEFQLVNKEELILEWVSCISNKSIEQYSPALHLLVKCLKSQHMTSFFKVVSPESCLKFLKKAKKYCGDEEQQRQVRDCSELMMTLTCFQLYYKNNISTLSKTVSMHYSSIAVCGHKEDVKCGTCPAILLQLYNKIILKDEFAIQFLDKMMPPVFSLPESLCHCFKSYEMLKLMTQIFFRDARTVAEMSYLEKYLTDPTSLTLASPVTQALVRTLTQSVINNDENAMTSFFDILLLLFIKNTKTSSLKLFICFCSTLGFRYNQESIQLEHKIECQKGLKIILVMINRLQTSKVSDTDENNTTFLGWMTSLLRLLMSPAYGISEYVLAIIQSVLNFVPIIYFRIIPEFVKYIMIPQKDDNLVHLYSLTLNSIMDISQKLTKTNQVLSVMIETIDLQLKENPTMLPPCKIMLPLEFYHNFERLVQEMSPSQSFETAGCLLRHLSLKIAEPLEVSNERIEGGQLIILEFITSVLECLLRNTKTANISQESQCFLIANMASILKKLGLALLKQTFNKKFTDLFLKLCQIWGDCVFLIKNYDDTNCFERHMIHHNVSSLQTKNDDGFVCEKWNDISYTFIFLNSEEWNFIGERVINFGTKRLKDNFCNMVIKNLNLLKVADDLTESKTVCTLKMVFSVADPKWLWTNLFNYIPYIDENLAMNLVTVLIDSKNYDCLTYIKKKCIIQNLDDEKGRMIIVLMGLGWLRQIGYILSRSGMNKTQNLMDIIENENCVIAELAYGTFFDDSSDSEENDDSFTVARVNVHKYANKMLKQFLRNFNEPKTVDSIHKNNFQKIQCLLELVSTLKITGLSPRSRKLILLGLLSILREIGQQTEKPPQLILTIISELLVQNIQLGSDLWLKIEFVHWLYNTFTGHSQKKVIFNLICDCIVRRSDVAPEFIESLVSNLEIAPLIMSAYIRQQQSNKRKREDSEKTVQITKQNLDICMDIVRKILKQLFSERGVQSEELHAFTVLLKHSLHSKSVKKIKWCSKHLPAFYNIVFMNITNPIITDITNELFFIETVFSNWTMFRSKLDQHSHSTLWISLTRKANISTASTASTSCMHLLLEAFSVEEYVAVLEALKEETIKNNAVDTNLISLDKAWEVIINAKVNAEKIKKRLSYLNFLESEFSSLTAKWVTTTPETSNIRAVFYILAAIIRTPTIRIGPENLDVVFILMSVLPPNDFEAINIGLNLLSNLLNKRSSLVMLHLPSFLQRCRFYLTCLVEASIEEVPEFKLINLYKCTNAIEHLALEMVNNKKDFASVVPNLVADIIILFENHTVNPILKRSLTNTINAFLNICSKKKVDYLMQVLSPASREIFKKVYINYNKFHRYHGKI